MSAPCRHALLVASLALCALLLRPATDAVGGALRLPSVHSLYTARSLHAAEGDADRSGVAGPTLAQEALPKTAPKRVTRSVPVPPSELELANDVELVADAYSR